MPKRLAALTLVLFLLPQAGQAGENVLQDPGLDLFYFHNERGIFVPEGHARWTEFSFGGGSVTWDASVWDAPDDMLAERPLGFSPGAFGYEGMGHADNSGHIILQQDVVDPALFQGSRFYEAWVWLGGAGNDDDRTSERKDEVGGWDIFFYGSTDVRTWTEQNALEHHRVSKDFSGRGGSFEQVAGYGRWPRDTVGFRIRVWASTWALASPDKNHNTRVALDNAHFAIIDEPNLLTNGDFEQDQVVGQLVGWDRPAAWPFPPGDFVIRDLINIYEDHFDWGTYRPYYGHRNVYGYVTFLDGWQDNSWSMSQTVDWNEPPGTPATLMCYWLQNTNDPARHHYMRNIGSDIQYVIRYLDGTTELDVEQIQLNWPTAANGANIQRYDQNANFAYNPRVRLLPPDGTNRMEVNINVNINMLYADDRPHVSFVVDDFYLGAGIAPPVSYANIQVR